MDDARSRADDRAPRPRLLWGAAARLGAALVAVAAMLLEVWARIRGREPRRWTDIERARRARAARLISGRTRRDGRHD